MGSLSDNLLQNPRFEDNGDIGFCDRHDVTSDPKNMNYVPVGQQPPKLSQLLPEAVATNAAGLEEEARVRHQLTPLAAAPSEPAANSSPAAAVAAKSEGTQRGPSLCQPNRENGDRHAEVKTVSTTTYHVQE